MHPLTGAEATVTDDPPTRCQGLLDAGRFQEARDAFEEILAGGPDAIALEGLATACRVLDDIPATRGALERAYRCRRAEGHAGAAAVDALTLADVTLEHSGTLSVARGWLSRADQLIAGLPEESAHVRLAGMQAYVALAYDKDPAGARGHAVAAVQVAERLGAQEDILVGQAYLGLIDVMLGDLDGGMRKLECVATAAAAGELSVTDAFDTYCLLLTACERIRDAGRVVQWAERVMAVAEAGGDTFGAFARTQYAGAMLLAGRWVEAEAALEQTVRDGQRRPLTVAMSLITRARLRLRQGRADEADRDLSVAEREPYRRAVRHLVLVGRAAHELARGEAESAADLAERYLRMVSPEDVIERVDGLEVLVRARLALGDLERADQAVEELTSTAQRVPTAGIRGTAGLCRARVAGEREGPEAAVPLLEQAVDDLDESGLAFETIEARIALAEALCGCGHSGSARREAAQARAAAEELGAGGVVALAAQIEATLRPADGGALTSREVQVLRLAAQGLTNGEIAERLVLSVRTVERHLSNIYLAVGATGSAARSVAIAYAHRTHLI
ncbi:LuxR family transcriptional regulator [Ruania alba]|uniref:Regulatory protein, luxR family n=1 Tax=Ruania alba TaxID=648782 RepID=A0A1H5CDW2_9MICO|nr:LuxR family transcriptional regulator [Ruania alba]SED64594.1 regulatory protein, luxR family [Ruania alba]